MAAMLSDEMFALFTKWRVGAFGRRLREVCEDEACDALSFEEKIELCVEAELEARESRKIEKAVRQARFKIRDACVEEVYYLPERSLTRDRVARLATCAWVDARENLVIVSESGGGQSYPDFQRLVLLSDYYEMSLDELVRGVDVGDVRALNESEKQISSIYSDVERGKEAVRRAWRALLVVGCIVLALFALVVAYGVSQGGLFVR